MPTLITSPGNRVLTWTSSLGSSINRPLSLSVEGCEAARAGRADKRMDRTVASGMFNVSGAVNEI